MLLLPNAVRTSLATRNVSSLVQRDDEMPPIEPRPYSPWMRLNSPAARSSASCQVHSRHGSVIFSRIIGVVMRSRCVV